jgi:8-oxo-dGTP pyrophosphatase MutT (NUDIX family)
VGRVRTPAGELLAIVRATVAERPPIDERERDSIERTLAELDRLPAPFDQHAGPVHVTGSGLVIGERGIVLLKHRRLGIWVQPGGHVDPGETPWEAARRETGEETGLTVRFLDPAPMPALAHVDVHPGGRGHTHLDLRYWLEAPGESDPSPPADESQEIGWFSWEGAVRIAEPAMAGILGVAWERAR